MISLLTIGGFYEDQHTFKMISMMRSKKSIFDIGVSLGYYAITFANLSPCAKIFALESIQSTFVELCDNMRLNNLQNVITVNCGLSDNRENDKNFMYFVIQILNQLKNS